MVKTPSSHGVKKAGGQEKPSKKQTPVAPSNHKPATAGAPDEDQIRERAYGIWIEEGRPHGRDLAHWRRASYELQREAR